MPKTQRESIARAFGEVVQTRTWNLLVDLVAQTGHFKPNAGSLQNDFVVEGEQHYWVLWRSTGSPAELSISRPKW